MRSRLLLRPRPESDESIYSWISRLCDANSSRNKRRILELAGAFEINKRIQPIAIFTKSQLVALAELTGVPQNRIFAMTWAPEIFDDQGGWFSKQFLFNQRAKVCPLCLEEACYWRRCWQLLPVTCCVEHRVRLSTSCKCGRAISIFPDSVECCVCGRSLSKQHIRPASKNELEIAGYILRAYNGENQEVLTDRLWEVQFALWFWYQGYRKNDLQLIRSWSYRRIVKGIQYVGGLIKGVDLSIAPLIQRYLNISKSKHAGFRLSLGDCHDYVNRMIKLGYRGEIGRYLKAFEEEEWIGSALLCRARYGAESSLLSKKEVQRQLGVSESKLNRLMSKADEKLIYREFKGRIYIQKDSLCYLKKVKDCWVELSDIMDFVGLSRNQVVQLIKRNLIQGFRGKGQRDWLISIESCVGFLNKLKGLQESNTEGVRTVTLSHIQSFPGIQFSSAIEKCLSGEVRFLLPGGDQILRSVMVFAEDVEKLYQLEKEELLSARDVSLLLGVNLNAVYFLIKSRLLKTDMRTCRNRKVVGVSVEHVQEFKTNYCFHSDLVAYLLSKGCRDRVTALSPVTGNKKCTGRIRVYRWIDVQRLVLSPIESREGVKSSRLFLLTAAADFIGITKSKLKSYISQGWIVPYTSPSHHKPSGNGRYFTKSDLERLQLPVGQYPSLMPSRAVASYLGYDRSHIRKQFLLSGYLKALSIPEIPREVFCYKREVFALKRLLNRTVSGPGLAKLCGVTRNTIYKWMCAGKLKPIMTPNDAGFGFYRYKTDVLSKR